MWIQGGMAVMSMMNAQRQRTAQIKAAVADAKLQRAQLERARLRQAGDFATNTQRMREATQRQEIEIEKNRIQAESRLETTFAGSGISGTSVDELDNEINAEVERDKYANKKALDQNLADQYRSYSQGTQDINANAQNIAAPIGGGGMFERLSAGLSGAAAGQQLVSGLRESGYNPNAAISKGLGIK